MRIIFNSVESLMAALVAISTGRNELWIFDGPDREASVLCMRAWVVQGRGMTLME